jgi:hypothetical protein
VSHVAQCSTVYKNLEDIAEAAKRLGGDLLLGEKKLRWYEAGFVDDSTMWRSMFSKEDADKIATLPTQERRQIINDMMNSVDHVVRFPGIGYDVGVYAQPDGTYRLRWDGFNHQLNQRMGGYSGGHFSQAYGVVAATRAANMRGWRTSETRNETTGHIELEVMVR